MTGAYARRAVSKTRNTRLMQLGPTTPPRVRSDRGAAYRSGLRVTTQQQTRSPQVSVIALRNATKRFPGAGGQPHTAVRDLTFTVDAGEFVAVVGPTGCGKSTTWSLVSGLEPPSSGDVDVDGQPVRGIPDGVGYMFQSDAVLP